MPLGAILMPFNEITTPDELPLGSVRLGPKVAWTKDPASERVLFVWHWCDHHLWAGRGHYDSHKDEYIGWFPAGVGAHDLVSLDPLHLEPSVYWPDCCGMHGFIHGGAWIDV